MTISLNEWYTFTDVVDNKTCNKLKRLASNKWVESAIDVQKGVSEE